MGFAGCHLTECGVYWNEISTTLALKGALEIMSEISYGKLPHSSHEIYSIVEKTLYKEFDKNKAGIPSCPSYLR